MSTKFFYFVCRFRRCCHRRLVLYYTPFIQSSIRFLKNFIFYKFHLHISSIVIYKQPIKLSMGCYPIIKTIVLLTALNNFHQYKKDRFHHLLKVPVTSVQDSLLPKLAEVHQQKFQVVAHLK